MDQSKSREKVYRNKALTWIALVILIGMSYLEAVDDSRDILELKKYAFVLDSDFEKLPRPKLIFLGKIGEHYFFRDHLKEEDQNSSRMLKTYIYSVDDNIFQEGMILYSFRK